MKLKIFILTVLIASLSIAGASASKKSNRSAGPVTQVSLSGTVVDKVSNEQLAGVVIEIPSIDQKIYSDVRGEFKLDGLEPGTYTVKVNCLSYKDKELSLKVTKVQNDNVKIVLTPIEP